MSNSAYTDNVARLEAFARMTTSHDGEILLGYIESLIDDAMTQLLACPKEEMLDYRGQINALRTLFEDISSAPDSIGNSEEANPGTPQITAPTSSEYPQGLTKDET